MVAGTRVYVSGTWGVGTHVLTDGTKVNAYDFIRVTSYGTTQGLPIVASAAGEVVGAKFSSTTNGCATPPTDYANYVKIQLPDGTQNWYWHLAYSSTPAVKIHDHVAMGQIVGNAGNTGCSTGAHLHFQLNSNSAKYYFVEGGNAQLAIGKKMTSANYAPITLAATRPSPIRVEIEWTYGGSDSPSFTIQRRASTTTSWTTAITLTSIGDGLDRDTVSASVETYYYRICSKTSFGTNCSQEVRTYNGPAL
jgi:murein DD-endopeptidase MepM/ murein hydrolase activator NlpD